MIKQAYPALAEANQEELVRQQFFKGISHDNKLEVTRIGLEHPISTLIRKLEEIERRKAELMLGSMIPILIQSPLIHDLKLTQKILI